MSDNPTPTFGQFVKRNWFTYLPVLAGPIIVFVYAAMTLKLSMMMWILAPLVILFLVCLTTLTLYNRWYPYFGPRGILSQLNQANSNLSNIRNKL